ncbi:hypothetical protein MTR67_011822 [Solanum verrucosum]|uniref:CCHC-type domain-containing protein n=1 Tax=Solanum verrucosum TaxID=315347 RepID=A0AAF0Q8U2_SOLVR|nr:hypothetical protein MTR67_011822 [Solanum verrucosum]
MKVGNGNKIKFWKDEWHEKGNLETLFPDIYNLAMFQQRTIAELWTPQGWNFIFRREPNDWEVMRLAEFLNMVGHFTGLQAYEDMLWWKGNNRGEFKVHSAYRLMDQSSQQSPIWPWKQIWKCRIPHKVSISVIESSVTYWVDKQASNNKSEFIPLDGNSIPLYDRGYSFALTATDSSTNVERGMEMVDSSRCFNCGSYGHALKECPKPRDNAAVNSARKQHKSRRNQSASSRNPTRYYQDSPRGKYDGLRPGALDSETRKLLGLGELDPPPWINRMRQMGYPPGYLEEDEDQPSGITIFADEKNKEETEEGEILDKSFPNPPRKMSVDFPGVNAPIPEHANERRWEAAPSSSRYSRSYSHNRYNHAQDYVNRGHYHEQRRSRDFEDDGPPGCDPGTSPSLSSYSYRYGAYDSRYSSHSPRDSASMPRSPSLGRSLSQRERRSPIIKDGSYHHSFYGSPR